MAVTGGRGGRDAGRKAGYGEWTAESRAGPRRTGVPRDRRACARRRVPVGGLRARPRPGARGRGSNDQPGARCGRCCLRPRAGRDDPPANFLRATRRQATDAFEQRLLDVSDRGYGLILAALRERFTQQEGAALTFRDFAVSAMVGLLDDSNRVLVQRGLLPPFTLP